jgi:hypothetical protein
MICKNLKNVFKVLIYKNFLLMNKIKNFIYFNFKFILQTIMGIIRFEKFHYEHSLYYFDIFLFIMVLFIVLLWFV